MDFITKIRQIPAFMRMWARDNFDSVVRVTLPDWRDLDRATLWCEHRWRSDGRHYRRRVFVDERFATFEFANYVDALAFRLAAAKRFKSS